MAKGFSKAILMGNVTRDIELKTTASGQTVASFSLAVSRTWRDQGGNQQEQTSFINCVAWGKAGEIIAQYVQKGSPLLVSGRLDQRSYEDKDGNKRQAVEVVVEDFNFIGGRGGEATGSISSTTAAGAKSATSRSTDDETASIATEINGNTPIDLSDIPF